MQVWIMTTYHVKNIWAAAGVCCVLILSGVLSGCFPTEKRNTADLETEILSGSQELAGEKPVTRLREIPETVSEESEEVSIQARVDIGNREAVLEPFTAVKKPFQFDDIVKILPEEETFTLNTENPDPLLDIYQGSSGGSLTIQDGRIYYISGRSSDKSYNVLIGSPMQLDDRQIVNEAFVSDSIPGLDKQQVIQQAGRWMETIGIQGLGEPQVAALDYATLQEEYEKIAGDLPKGGETPFEPEDEGYYLLFRSEEDGIPYLAQDYFLQDKVYCFGSVVEMIVTKNGLQYFMASGMYDRQEESEPAEELYDFRKILGKIRTKYKDVMLEEPVVIDRIELIYAPDVISDSPQIYELSPCWAVYARSSSQSPGCDLFFYYSAITGEELGIE